MNDNLKLVITTTLIILLTPAAAHAHTPAQVRSVVRAEVKAAGGSTADADSAVWIAYRESSWRDTATNGRCVGIFQALLSPREIRAGHWKDPRWATRWADRYAKHRYGSWTRAKAFWQRHHWW